MFYVPMKKILLSASFVSFLLSSSCPVMCMEPAEEQPAAVPKKSVGQKKRKQTQKYATPAARPARSAHPVIALMQNLDAEVTQQRTYIERTQDEINDCVLSTAKQAYGFMNRNWVYAPPKEEMTTESPFWEPRVLKESNAPTLILKANPNQLVKAMDDLVTKPALLECSIAITTAKIFV